MKNIYTNYTFNPTSKTIILVGASSSINLENILLVTNVTSGSIIYNFADPTASGSYNQVNSALSLSYNTTTMRSVDRLQIYTDIGNVNVVGGQAADSTPLTGSPILIGAKVVDASTYAPAYSTTSVATLAIDKTSGAVLVSQGNLTPFADNVGIFGTDNVTWQAATVISASLSKSINTQVLVVQPVDANGNIISNTSSIINTVNTNTTASIINTVTVGSHAVTITSGNLNVTGSVTASLLASEARIGTIGGTTYYVTSSFTRTPDTTPYVAGDVVCTSSVGTNILLNAARIAGGSGTILNAKLVNSSTSATTGSYEAYIFNSNRTSEADNTLFSASVSDAGNLIAVIPFKSSYVVASASLVTAVYTTDNILQPFVCSPNTSSLYWNLVVRNIYTGSSAEAYNLKLGILVD